MIGEAGVSWEAQASMPAGVDLRDPVVLSPAGFSAEDNVTQAIQWVDARTVDFVAEGKGHIWDNAAALGSDLVLVDGNHQYDNVKSDSENAFRMLSDRGIIIWHDYTVRSGHQHPDVIKYLNELSNSIRLFNLAGTCFVIALAGGKRIYDH